MANFFVGQLVRVVGYNSFPELVGSQCSITGIDIETFDIKNGKSARGFIGTDIPCPDKSRKWTAFYAAHLEPILYDGAQPIAESFEEMMGKLREGVVA